MRALTEAGIALTSELSLQAVLQRLLEVAKAHVGARYAAMSILGPDGETAQFISSGISDEERERIGDPPDGHGLLGLLLREGQSLRLPDIEKDPRHADFPPNHPPMKSLLGVPVVHKGRVIGNLYLTVKQGAPGFSEHDQEILESLAAQAAVAIHNAELFEEATRSAAEWKALFELGGMSPPRRISISCFNPPSRTHGGC